VLKDMQYTIESDDLWRLVEQLLVFPYPQICRHTVVLWIADAFMKKLHAEDPCFKAFGRRVVRGEDDEALDMLCELREKDCCGTDTSETGIQERLDNSEDWYG
jgi:hypothetical protein